MSRVAELMDLARQQTGLTHFGEDSFREGLEILIASADREGGLNALGRGALDGQVVTLLSNRLQIEDWYARHPEIDEQEIVRPLIGLGLPRTGSTALGCLLGEDPAVRSIRGWEAQAPCPPPEAATQHSDPRISRMEASAVRRDELYPRMGAMLPDTTTSPTECQFFMGCDFKSQVFQPFANIPTYIEWLVHEADLVPTYRYVKRILKLLQWRCPPTRWRLKNPSHSLFINALDQVYPDALFCMTHRDVASVIPSVADLYYELRRPLVERPDLPAIGRECADFCELGMRRMIAFREAGAEHRFFDIQFAPFQKDPFPILEDLYAFLGEAFTAEARARMQAWRRSKPREAQVYARTPMAEFGFDRDQLHKRFAFYSDRFNVPLATE